VKVVSVIGDGRAPEGSELYNVAYEVGKLIAKKGYVLVTGGLFGVMEGASRGAKEEGGLVIGILPTYEPVSNPYVDVKIPTGLGQSRNVLVVSSASSLVVAVGGSYGTLSEIGHALKLGKKVLGFKTWRIEEVDYYENLKEFIYSLSCYLR
jgi:uncharacterized protein (TIGR00725 family)